MDDDIRIRAAWLYHVGGLSQDEVGRRLGLSRFKVLRLLSDARAAGEVVVSLDHRTVGTLALAEALRIRFGLTDALVAPDPVGRVLGQTGSGRTDIRDTDAGSADADVTDKRNTETRGTDRQDTDIRCTGTGGTVVGSTDADAVRRAVGMVAARWFCGVVATGSITVGVGWGRTLSAMADALTGLHNPQLRVVSLMGAMVRTGPEGPIDVCARIAAVAGGQALFLPAPFLADTPADAAVMIRQRLVREALEAARGASHMIISVGEGGRDALLTSSGVLDAADLAALTAAGAVGDTTGKFLRADGTLAPVDLNDRTPSIGLDDMARADVTLLAAGVAKAQATRAVLRAGLVNRIVADEALARVLMEDTA